MAILRFGVRSVLVRSVEQDKRGFISVCCAVGVMVETRAGQRARLLGVGSFFCCGCCPRALDGLAGSRWVGSAWAGMATVISAALSHRGSRGVVLRGQAHLA